MSFFFFFLTCNFYEIIRKRGYAKQLKFVNKHYCILLIQQVVGQAEVTFPENFASTGKIEDTTT